MAQLLTAAAQANENYTGIAARDTANALRVLTDAVRGVSAAFDDKNDQKNIINAAREVMLASAKLLEEAKKATSNPNDPNNQERLGKVCIDWRKTSSVMHGSNKYFKVSLMINLNEMI